MCRVVHAIKLVPRPLVKVSSTSPFEDFFVSTFLVNLLYHQIHAIKKNDQSWETRTNLNTVLLTAKEMLFTYGKISVAQSCWIFTTREEWNLGSRGRSWPFFLKFWARLPLCHSSAVVDIHHLWVSLFSPRTKIKFSQKTLLVVYTINSVVYAPDMFCLSPVFCEEHKFDQTLLTSLCFTTP